MDLSIQESNHEPLQSTTTAIIAPSAPPASSLAINGSSTSHMASQPLPSPEDQLKAYQNVSGTPMKAGQTWYLINLIWFKRWQEACGSIDPPINLKTTQNSDPITIQTLGQIDNTDLLESDGDLKPGLRIGSEIEIIPESFWNLISNWYGYKPNSIPRRVITTNGIGNETLEFYPPKFHFYLFTSSFNDSINLLPNHSIIKRFSIGSTFKELKDQIIQDVFNPILTRSIRLWRLSNSPHNHNSELSTQQPLLLSIESLPNLSPELINPKSDEIDLNEALLTDSENFILIEQISKDNQWQIKLNDDDNKPQSTQIGFGGQDWLDQMERMNKINNLDPKYKFDVPNSSQNGSIEASSSKGSSTSNPTGFIAQLKRATGLGGSNSGNGSEVIKINHIRGLVGLSNLGNTCFMNSALQCMSNCPELKQYFLSGVYTRELNRVNPLGMGGKVAETFGQLIEKLWTGSPNTSVAPREFKSIVGRFNSLFLGYGQQDSQELLTFLLDALHEDLNRVLKKPFDEIPDFKDGDGDEELVKLAQTCWELYRRRNDSVIVDLFQGQYKSTLVCPDCDKVAIKFDEIMYLTLQLPVNKKHKGTVYFIPLDPSKPRLKVIYELPKDSTIRQLRRHVGQILGYDPDKMAVVEDWSGKPWKVWQDTDSLEAVMERDVMNIYETPMAFSSSRTGPHFEPNGPVLVPVVSYRPVDKGIGGGLSSNAIHRGNKSLTVFGVSFLVFLQPHETLNHEDIYDAVVRQYARYTKKAEELFEEAEEVKLEVEADKVKEETEKMDGDVEMRTSSGSPGPSLGRAVPNLFRISVPAQPTPTLIPTSNAMGVSTIGLTERELHGRAGPAVRVPGSLSLDEEAEEDLYGDDIPVTVATTSTADEEPAKAEDEKPTPSTLPTPTQPLVRQGDFFECEWTSASISNFFGDRTLSESKGWSDPEIIEDPSIAKSILEAKKVLTIEDCFKDFSKPEQLGEDDKWFCPRCKIHVQAIKTMQIWKVPDILVVHFKRFSNARTTYGRSTKVDEYVEFPINGLDLSNEVEGYKVLRKLNQSNNLNQVKEEEEEEESESLIYDLFAVDNHFGGLGGGHYTAFAKNVEDGKWHNFDDSQVSEVANPEKIKSSAAYLLFYRRRSNKNLGSKTHEIVSNALESGDLDNTLEETSGSRIETDSSSGRCVSPSSEPQGLESPKPNSIFEIDSPPAPPPVYVPVEDETEIVHEVEI
ncbi:hypothetical protein CROQUDRAFT_56628 [Cronartium quercuum f. sp. fusiforme G11]|uniref:ubiquitinyl hydrolase 1 n=1 Tax=Cronartium quercuum f. sp. fusiforme G11 TaxID=708437 RepID=A0A9P6THG9_9BASI|nr:hypothetical protein CROQUDRAFT_56628 [Cronartium quercuum f. sp. fusiforme G11]